MDFNELRTFEKGEIVYVSCNNEAYVNVEYVGRSRHGEFIFESCTFGNICTLSKDQTQFTMGSKTYDVDYIK